MSDDEKKYDTELANQPITRGDLFNLISPVYRALSLNYMALISLQTNDQKSLVDEIRRSGEELDELYKELHGMIGAEK